MKAKRNSLSSAEKLIGAMCGIALSGIYIALGYNAHGWESMICGSMATVAALATAYILWP